VKKIAILFSLIMLLSLGAALSPQEATDFVSKTNNYLIEGEQAQILPSVTITYRGSDYWVVAAVSRNNPNAFIPINDKKETVATGDIEARKLIETAIVLRNINLLKGDLVLGWHLSISNKNFFFDLSTGFTEMISKAITVKTELGKLSSPEAQELESLADDIIEELNLLNGQSEQLANFIDQGMEFENNFLDDPDTNELADYEDMHLDIFDAISKYKESYNALNLRISNLKQGISALGELTLNDKSALNQTLNLPAQTQRLNSFFGEIDNINESVQGIFSQTSRVDTFVSTLDTRIVRNEAWQILFGVDDDILDADSRFDTLERAAQSILSEENVDLWVAQDDVEALRVNWTQATSRYNSSKYETAKNSGKDAKKNVLRILEEGIQETSTELPQEIIIQAIIILIVIGIGIFLFEKFVMKKKEEEYEEEY